jgi:coproporphyrinogen III oxidase-like Fe-S oxidoreductase
MGRILVQQQTLFFLVAISLVVVSRCLQLQSLSTPLNAYVHIPFCRRRCFYCDFPIVVTGNARRDSLSESYVNCLVREIEATSLAGFGPVVARGGGLQTIYFGGGTPSLLDPLLLGTLVEKMADCYGIAENCEITLEMVRKKALFLNWNIICPCVFVTKLNIINSGSWHV